MAQITKIHSNRVYFINLNSNKEEYIEIKNIRSTNNMDFDFRKKTNNNVKTGNNFIRQIGENKFQVNRSDMNKHLRSLPASYNLLKLSLTGKMGK